MIIILQQNLYTETFYLTIKSKCIQQQQQQFLEWKCDFSTTTTTTAIFESETAAKKNGEWHFFKRAWKKEQVRVWHDTNIYTYAQTHSYIQYVDI